MKALRIHWLPLIFFLFFIGSASYKLIAHPTPFYDWDEPLYVEGGIEMIRDRYYLFPLWQGHIWMDKPPVSSLLYGLAAQLPLPVEVSTRLLALYASVAVLILAYVLYYRVTKSVLIAVLTVVGTAYAPIFIQRAQVVNLDVFLLLGWLGYFVYKRNSIIATLFLLLSTQSKSLLGFYPLAIMTGYYLYTRQFKKYLPTLLRQGAILSVWYIAMGMLYGQAFWQAHIIESHFRRVSSSIESHFGARTFYITLLYDQIGYLAVAAAIGFILFLWQWYKGKVKNETFLLATAFIPWFLFLNLTKTKIAWYLYPVIPQFFFLASYPLVLIKPFKLLYGVVGFAALLWIWHQGYYGRSFATTFYSKEEEHHAVARIAKQSCDTLGVLVSSDTRNTYKTLKDMGLTITTTDWWGDHPSMVYYFGKPIRFFYDTASFQREGKNYSCIALRVDDEAYVPDHTTVLKEFSYTRLYTVIK